MIHQRFENHRLILASQSPRRQYLLKELGLHFEIITTNIPEKYPENLTPDQVAVFLAELKADSFDTARLDPKSIIISADTIVCIENEILGKPGNYKEAVSMLLKLSGRKHEVITAFCLKTKSKRKTFSVISAVYFKAKVLTIHQEVHRFGCDIKNYKDEVHYYDRSGPG